MQYQNRDIRIFPKAGLRVFFYWSQGVKLCDIGKSISFSVIKSFNGKTYFNQEFFPAG